MFPNDCLDMSIRLPYFGDQSQTHKKTKNKEPKNSVQYFAGYPLRVVSENDKGRLVGYLCSYCDGLPRNIMQMDCGHRTCKTCYDFRVFVSKKLEKTSDEVFCPTCRSENPNVNKYSWLNIELVPDNPFSKQESRKISITECPIEECKGWMGGSLFALYRHEASHHAHLESQRPLSDLSIDQYKLLTERLVTKGEYLDGDAAGVQSKKKQKKQLHKTHPELNKSCSEKRPNAQTFQETGSALKSTELTVKQEGFNEEVLNTTSTISDLHQAELLSSSSSIDVLGRIGPGNQKSVTQQYDKAAREYAQSENYREIVQFLQKQWDEAINSPDVVWYSEDM